MHTRLECLIRWLIRRDLDRVLAIEADSFPNPWPEADFIAALRERNVIGKVAEYDDQVVGFMLYALNRDSLEILNLAVAECWRRHGIGRQMLSALAARLDPKRRRALKVIVRETNLAAQLFFAACGFRATCVLRDRFLDSGEDAYHFEYSPFT